MSQVAAADEYSLAWEVFRALQEQFFERQFAALNKEAEHLGLLVTNSSLTEVPALPLLIDWALSIALFHARMTVLCPSLSPSQITCERRLRTADGWVQSYYRAIRFHLAENGVSYRVGGTTASALDQLRTIFFQMIERRPDELLWLYELTDGLEQFNELLDLARSVMDTYPSDSNSQILSTLAILNDKLASPAKHERWVSVECPDAT